LAIVEAMIGVIMPKMTASVAGHRWICAGSPALAPGASASVVADIDEDLDHHPGPQEPAVLLERDSHRQALGHLGEVAAGVGIGKQRELAGRRLADQHDAALEATIRVSVDLDSHRLPDRHPADLRLANVGLHVDRVGIVEQHDALTRLHVLTDLDERERKLVAVPQQLKARGAYPQEIRKAEKDAALVTEALHARDAPLVLAGLLELSHVSSQKSVLDFELFVFLPGSAQRFGLFFTAYVAVAILERLFFGWLPDRVGRKLVLYPSMASLVLGFFVLAGTGSWVGVAIAGALCGAGHGFAFPILTAMVVDRAPDTDRGSAMSFFTALLDIGTLIGGPLFGAIIDTAGWDPMFVVAGIGLGIATFIFARWDRWATSDAGVATADRV